MSMFRPGRLGSRQKKPKKVRSWTGKFFCFSETNAYKVPSSTEKDLLQKAGLGNKNIQLMVTDNAETVQEKIKSEYAKLKDSGGFELLRCMSNCRRLAVLDCNWDTVSLRSVVGCQAKIYIRPIQKSLSIDGVDNQHVEELNEKCEHCSEMINVRSLRVHLESCGLHREPAVEQSNQSHQTTNDFFGEGTTQGETMNGHQTTYLVLSEGSNINDVASLNIDFPEMFVQSQVTTENQSPLETTNASTVLTETGANDNEETLESKVTLAVNLCKDYCAQHNITNPINILQIFQSKIVTGRPLEITDEAETVEGETNFILVDRNSLAETALSEIKEIDDLRKCLEVQFYGETAVDYGGPRREFFALILPELHNQFFDPIREWAIDTYETVGKIMALSTLQNGRLPRLMSEDLVQEVFFSDSPRAFAQYLRKGLDTLGLVQLTKALPTFVHLFAPHQSTPLTLKMMVNLLQPKFSEEGSNRRVLESAMYSRFVKYMREAASGRRGTVTLASILKFVTGAEEEPALGFSLKPTVIFTNSLSYLPLANTCISRLTLIIPEQMDDIPADEVLFSLFDYAFSNTYFGLH